jgi:hypothetical protein
MHKSEDGLFRINHQQAWDTAWGRKWNIWSAWNHLTSSVTVQVLVLDWGADLRELCRAGIFP